MIDNLYHVSFLFVFPSNENYHVSLKRNELALRHLRLYYINLNKIQKLIKFEILYSLIIDDLPSRKFYIEDKMIKRPFIVKGFRVDECLKLVHIY